jgi:hypothetical protein
MAGTPNVMTALMPSLFAGLNIVANESTDLIDAVNLNMNLSTAVKDQVITFPIALKKSTSDFVPGAATPDINGETPGTGTVTISKVKKSSFKWEGEQVQQLQGAGIYTDYYADQTAEAIRAIRNEVCDDIAALYKGACRAVGTAGTTPFPTANDLQDFANVNKCFVDNGMTGMEKRLIVDSTATANIQGKQTSLFRANEAGTDKLIRTGEVGIVEGLKVGISAGIKRRTAALGTGTNYVLDGAHVKGSTTLTVKTGSGTILAGDVFLSGGDSRQYVVKTALSGTQLTIAAPGLMVDHATGATLTLETDLFTPNMAFIRNAITLLARQPYITNEEGGVLRNKTTLRDPRTGLVYGVYVWDQYGQTLIDIMLAWGCAVTNSQGLIVLLG